MLNSMNQIWYGNILNEKKEAKNGLHINNMIWKKCMRIWLNETNDLMRDAVKECEKHIIWGYIEWEKLQHIIKMHMKSKENGLCVFEIKWWKPQEQISCHCT